MKKHKVLPKSLMEFSERQITWYERTLKELEGYELRDSRQVKLREYWKEKLEKDLQYWKERLETQKRMHASYLG